MYIRTDYPLVVACILALLQSPPTYAATGETRPDLFVRISLIRSELELIRLEMGRSRSAPSHIRVTGAVPREVFYQARELFALANRLSFEQTRERAPVPKEPVGKIEVTDVSVVLTAVLWRLRHVKGELGISQQSADPPRDAGKDENDVFEAVVEATRQLNLLLQEPITPSGVYQEVTSGVGYASRLLGRFPGVIRIPEAPPFEPRKRPIDVYRRLVACFQKVQRIAVLSGLQTVELQAENPTAQEMWPSDTEPLAALVVSELAYLHRQLRGDRQPRNVYYPGRKFPSHVYQRAGLLEVQLTELEKQVEARPDWLRRGDTWP